MNHTKTKEVPYFKSGYDVYSDPTPEDTVRIKYKTLKDVKNTIQKLESIYKSGERPHNRISKITNVMTQRLRIIDKNSERYKLSKRYFEFLKLRTKVNDEIGRKKMIFKI